MSDDTPTVGQKTNVITLPDPRRTWLLPCTNAFGTFGVCMIEVEQGSIAIYAPDGSENFQLGRDGIAEFRAAFAEAIDVAEADLRAEATVSAGS